MKQLDNEPWRGRGGPKFGSLALAALLLLETGAGVFGFSLLGPYSEGTERADGYRWPGDIGDPMDVGEGYRWNVPVLTYSFDQAFLDYFGSNGVAAVEGAIKILNDLPPASSLVLTNYPLAALRFNYRALADHLFDLKSVTLTLMLEQMGLAPPQRDVFDLRRWDPIFLYLSCEWLWPTGTIPALITERNFDPNSLAPSRYVNGSLFTGCINWYWLPLLWTNTWDVTESLVDPISQYYTAVADGRVADSDILDAPPRYFLGTFYQGLTQDDVGGLRFLLSTNNVNLESLLPGVHGVGKHAHSYVDLAPRPGVEKITLVREDYDSLHGQLLHPWTNRFTDYYYKLEAPKHPRGHGGRDKSTFHHNTETNLVLVHQQLERVATQPDFLFSAAELGQAPKTVRGYERTGTSNWWNSAAASGKTNRAGPGVIRPPVKMTFDRRGPWVETADDGLRVAFDSHWASFNASTNPPVVYPTGSSFAGADQLHVLLWLKNSLLGTDSQVAMLAPVPWGGQAVLQSSTNLRDWASLAVVTNHGGTVHWFHWWSQPQRFFRVVPQ